MENLDLEAVNRQFLLESQGYLGPIGSGTGSCTSSSSAHSDLFFYDDSSNSELSTYSYGTDDENSQESAGKCSHTIKITHHNLIKNISQISYYIHILYNFKF